MVVGIPGRERWRSTGIAGSAFREQKTAELSTKHTGPGFLVVGVGGYGGKGGGVQERGNDLVCRPVDLELVQTRDKAVVAAGTVELRGAPDGAGAGPS